MKAAVFPYDLQSLNDVKPCREGPSDEAIMEYISTQENQENQIEIPDDYFPGY